MAVNDMLDREERPAYVRFEKRAVEDKRESLKAGKTVYKDVDWVLVTPPYSKDCFEHKAELWFNNVRQNVKNGRTPEKWLDHWLSSYEKWKKGEAIPVNGTSVKNWPAISQAQCKTVLASGILTIEDLALANDEGVRRLGIGGVELKNKAVAYVKAAKDTGPVVMENAALKKKVTELELTIESLHGQIERLSQKALSKEEPDGISFDDIDPEPTLAERYEAKFGKKPHHLMKESTIQARINGNHT